MVLCLGESLNSTMFQMESSWLWYQDQMAMQYTILSSTDTWCLINWWHLLTCITTKTSWLGHWSSQRLPMALPTRKPVDESLSFLVMPVPTRLFLKRPDAFANFLGSTIASSWTWWQSGFPMLTIMALHTSPMWWWLCMTTPRRTSHLFTLWLKHWWKNTNHKIRLLVLSFSPRKAQLGSHEERSRSLCNLRADQQHRESI